MSATSSPAKQVGSEPEGHYEDYKGRITGIEVVLSQWLFDRIVKDKAVLSISPDYFMLTGGMERWLYRIARKHCGNNDVWKFSVEALFEKYPPGREFRLFKHDLKKSKPAIKGNGP